MAMTTGCQNHSVKERKLMDSKYNKIIKATALFVQEKLASAEGGHDWFHAERVWKLATKIAQTEPVDLFIVQLGALLHDIADSKFYGGDETIGPRTAEQFLQKQNVEAPKIEHVVNIIRHISFKGGTTKQTWFSQELAVVQDADRIDALGAIGIARTFNYGGHKGQPLYNPAIKPKLKMDKETYKKHRGPTINHFYEKLLLLKERMNTTTGKRIAQHRHDFMLNFLDQFYQEWQGL